MTDGLDREVSAELEELGRQVGELSGQMADTRKQLIKTANILGNLSAEVKAVGRQHQLERRGLTLNSAVAYVLFVGLTAAGFYFLYRSQVERLDSEKNALDRERGSALTKLTELRNAAERRREAEARAAAFYRLTRTGRVHEALRQYPEVAQLPLSKVEAAVFRDWADRMKSRIAYTAYSAGMKAVGAKEWKKAVTEFKNALTYMPHPPHEAPLRYYYGFALMKVGSYKEAVDELERALAAGAEKTVSREIRYHIGTIYEQTARREQAIRAYRGYVKRHPGTNFARAAQRRIKALQ
jgi:tetratricopeptide (TPR) repeat protein